VANTWCGLVVILLAPGPVADSIRSPGPVLGHAHAEVRICAPCGGHPVHGRLNLYGALRPLDARYRRAAALRLCEVAAREELIDAQRDDGSWLLAAMAPLGADWAHPYGNIGLDPGRIFDAGDDEVLRHSVGLCSRLNRDHPELAHDLAGRAAWLVELDRQGATLGIPGPRGEEPQYARVSWPTPCHDLDDLSYVLAGLPGVTHEQGCPREATKEPRGTDPDGASTLP
jgi:hypothetical protein